jgi:hypothetical protein
MAYTSRDMWCSGDQRQPTDGREPDVPNTPLRPDVSGSDEASEIGNSDGLDSDI